MSKIEKKLIKVAVTGPNGPQEVHKAGCRDLDQLRKYRREQPWVIDIADRTELATEIYGDVATDDGTEPDTDEWRATCREFFESEYRVMPCIAKQLIKEAGE